MKRLIEQTACEHGSYVRHCPGSIHLVEATCVEWCEGGSSREVTVDELAYAKEAVEAAAKKVRSMNRSFDTQIATEVIREFLRALDTVHEVR